MNMEHDSRAAQVPGKNVAWPSTQRAQDLLRAPSQGQVCMVESASKLKAKVNTKVDHVSANLRQHEQVFS